MSEEENKKADVEGINNEGLICVLFTVFASSK